MLDGRRERAAGRILDDERLRGSLEDPAFAPLQAWALAWVDAYAAATAGLEEADAAPRVESGIGWARGQVGAIVGLLDEWSALSATVRERRLAALAPTFPAPTLAVRARRLAAVGDPNAAATEIARVLPPAPRVSRAR